MNAFHIILHVIGLIAFMWVILGFGVVKAELDELKLRVAAYELRNSMNSVDEKGGESSEKSE